ncbi:hypothetical protein PACILC2_28940 [Paenibacillus cisolokensis]|uniref:ABC transmembrane type-1 domain-containing protein n=1 Tax=Paenibacillus cisolokensis TaxID=1658519 RepID=A0ABQ4N7Z2_9BACL|nr:hypothetical protein [Paenibacillus cisolokensis]GIQ64326.1 hypothetical protein PACILC2_28940 [Paenibacillus cisolokensis]
MVRSVLLFGISFIILYPIMTKISIAFKSSEDLFDSTVVWIPRNFTLDNVKRVMEYLDYYTAVTNTLLLSVSVAVLQLVSCALAGYGFARLKFWGSGVLFALVVFTIVIPPQTIMVPTYLHYRFFDVFGIYGLFTGSKGVNLLESYWPFFISSALAMGLKTACTSLFSGSFSGRCRRSWRKPLMWTGRACSRRSSASCCRMRRRRS